MATQFVERKGAAAGDAATALANLKADSGASVAAILVDAVDEVLKYYDRTNSVVRQVIPTNTAAIAAGATLTVTAALHAGRTILLNALAGSVVTLPAASGTGNRYRFVVSVLATSNSHIVKVANSTDIMQGMAHTTQDAGDTIVAFETAATDDTITFNRTTTGSVTRGEFIELQDIASGLWAVYVSNTATGTEATPFSATV